MDYNPKKCGGNFGLGVKFWIIIPQNNVLVISDYNTKLLLMVCYCMFIGVRGECVILGCVACFLVMGGGELEMKN